MSDLAGRSPAEDVLIGGLDDWIYASWVMNSIWELTAPDNRRTMTIGLIAELLVDGLIVPGDVDQDGHHPWPHSTGEAIERITSEWLASWRDDVPNPGAIVWLANTSTDIEVARRALEREVKKA